MQLSIEKVLEISLEDHLENVLHLSIRDDFAGCSGVDEDCARSLVNLESLSLSHQSINDLAPFKFNYFINLVEINLNFNALRTSELEHISNCTQLEKLFLSQNELDDECSVFFANSQFQKLTTLCLFGNKITRLSDILASLRKMSKKMTSLDLDGNPWHFDELEESNKREFAKPLLYKHTCIITLQNLVYLDGDRIKELDRELAALYFDDEGGMQKKQAKLEQKSNSPRKEGKEENVSRKRSFVSRLRENAYRSGEQSSTKVFVKENNTNDIEGKRDAIVTKEDDFLEVAIDLTNPENAIRSMQKELADLRTENAGLRKELQAVEEFRNAASLGLDIDEMIRENKSLQLENKNMYILMQENRDLKKRLMEKEPEMIAKLRYELRTVTERYETLRKACNNDRKQREWERVKSKDVKRVEFDTTDVDVTLREFEFEDDADAEVAALLKRNQANLKQLRKDIERF